MFRLLCEGEGKQAEPDASWCDILYDNGVTHLKEVLKMSICVLAWQATELACMYHRNEASLVLKVSRPGVDSGPNGHIGNNGGGVGVK